MCMDCVDACEQASRREASNLRAIGAPLPKQLATLPRCPLDRCCWVEKPRRTYAEAPGNVCVSETEPSGNRHDRTTAGVNSAETTEDVSVASQIPTHESATTWKATLLASRLSDSRACLSYIDLLGRKQKSHVEPSVQPHSLHTSPHALLDVLVTLRPPPFRMLPANAEVRNRLCPSPMCPLPLRGPAAKRGRAAKRGTFFIFFTLSTVVHRNFM